MSKLVKKTLITLIIASLGLSFSAGCTVISPPGNSSTTPASPAISQSRPATGAELDVIEEAWQIINQEYVEKDKINTANMTESAIRGMIDALNDPYTSYMNATTYELSRSDIHGAFEGIGAFVGIRENRIIIVAPMPESPAERAGLEPGDAILAVNGSSTEDMSLEEVVTRIRGPKGTTVTLQILPLEKTEPVEVKIVRASIEVPSVTFEMKGDIAYFRIFQFSDRTDEELRPKLREMVEKDPKGIILDLRSNPGGVLSEVVKVASHFIREGVIVSVVDNQGKKTSTSANGADIVTNLPIVALSDNFSASGSEVLMGALQDYGRATIAGTRTYGKGSVNTFYQLKDGSGLYITIARWLTPNGRLIEGKGIEPDIEMDLHGEEAIQWAIDYLKSKRN